MAFELRQFTMAMIEITDGLDNYIDPAPKMSIAAPRDGAIFAGTVHIDARADRPIAKWRLYVGAKMVEENESGRFEIPTLAPGPQILTVHAITADWLRSASQIQVSVSNREEQSALGDGTR